MLRVEGGMDAGSPRAVKLRQLILKRGVDDVSVLGQPHPACTRYIVVDPPSDDAGLLRGRSQEQFSSWPCRKGVGASIDDRLSQGPAG